MNRFLSIFLILTGMATSALAQSYTFRHYQVENGLSYNSVICSIQDKKGFMWFGTKDGLNRFDGYTFKIFKNDPDNPQSIGSNFIHCLYEDNNQNIWVGTLLGLYIYNPQTESFKLIADTKNKDIREIKMDRSGNVWYIAGLTLCRYNLQTKKLSSYDQRIHSGTTSLCVTANNQIWVSTTDGFIQRYLPQKNDFESFNVFNTSKPAISSWTEKLYDTGKGFLLIGTSNQGVKSFDIASLTYKDILTSNADQTAIYARDFIQQGDDEYWIATESGLFIYNIKTGKYLNLQNKFNDPYSISDNAVYTLCKDKEGGIWAGTYFGGVNYYPKEYTSFEKFFPQGGNNSLSGYAVREICSDSRGNIWIGTEDAGLNKLNPQTGAFTHFKPTGEKTSISHSNIHGLLASDHELWIGTFEHGLDVMDINSSKIIRHYSAGLAPNALKSNFIESLLKTKSGEILVGTSFGLYRYNKTSDDFSLLNEVPGNLHYSALLEDKHGNIWAGTLRDGLFYFNVNDRRSGYYKYEENNKNSLSHNSINSIYVDKADQMWVATEDGLCRFNEKEKNFRRYNTRDGFLSSVFYKMLEDKKNTLWISTSRGLANFNPKTKKIISYTRSNGLLSDQFNYSSGFQDQNGKMYFGSVKGMISFLPDQFMQNKFVSPVYITGFQVYNKELQINKKDSPLSQSISFTKVIRLNHNQSTFSIDFAALGYTAPEMTEYTFKMEGLDRYWTYLKTNRKVYFTNLFPGTYTFKLKAANSSSIWNDQITELKIIISPPIWASTIAFLLYGIAIAAAIYYGVRYYHQRINNKNKRKIELWESKKEKELYQAKIEFFTFVTHEIRTPLTLIKGPLDEVIKNSSGTSAMADNLVVMEKNTNRLIELTDQLLDFRKTEIKGFSLNFVNVNISKLLEENCLRYKSEAEYKNLELHISLPEVPLCAYADTEALNKILSNLIDNAIKYAADKIYIQLSVNRETFTVQVKSDGNLIPRSIHEKIFEPFYRMEATKSLKGTGIGLALARSLTELHEGKLIVKNEGSFNVFVLTLPQHHEREFKINADLIQPAAAQNSIRQNENPDAPTILVVEDNIEIRDFITDRLITDFSVITAGNGQEAIDILKEKSIHLIISDIMMPVMDGLELCKTLKDDPEYSHIPMILLTAKNTLQSKIEGLEVGADAYLEKPFSPDHLLTQISNLLASRDKMKNYFANSPLVHIKSMAYNKADEAFLEQLNEAINKNIDNKSLDVDQLAELMNMSRPTLYRKIKAISNLSPHELINITRLKKAAGLLVESNYKILKIASMTGFSSQAQFGRCFLKQFGMTPSEYADSKHLANQDKE